MAGGDCCTNMSERIQIQLQRAFNDMLEARNEYNALFDFHPPPWTAIQKVQFKSKLQLLKQHHDSLYEYIDKWEDAAKKIKDADQKRAEYGTLDAWIDKAEHRRSDKEVAAIILEGDGYMQLEYQQPPDASNVSVCSDATQDGSCMFIGKPIPPLNIPKFTGNYLDWNSFWQRFKQLVHERPYPAVEKLIALYGLLDGKALKAVEGFQMAEENYDTVVQILSDRFGNHNMILQELHTKLRSIPRAKPSAESMRDTVDAVNRICRELKNFGVDVDNDSTKLDIIDKMPPNEKDELSFMNVSNPRPSTDAILDKMARMVLKAEIASKNRSLELSQKPSPFIQQSSLKVQKESDNSFIPSSSTQREGRTCCLCEKHHNPSKCPEYPTVQDKIQKLQVMNRCTSCMRSNHQTKDCKMPSSFKCRSCGSLHYAFLCPQKDKLSLKPKQTNNFLAVGRSQGTLLTKKCIVANPDTGETTQATVFFDPGSQRSYITDDLIKLLKVQRLHHEKLNVQGFGAKASTYNSALVKVEIKTNQGGEPIFANSAHQIATAVPVIEAEGFDLTDYKSTNAIPDILVGMDYFFHFVTSFAKVKDELYIVNSKVGNMLCGQLPSHSSSTVSSLAIEEDQMENGDYQQLWKMEAMGIVDDSSHSKEDEIALEKFKEGARFVKNRFYVSWPLKPDHKPLPSNAGLAIGRLRSTVKKLINDPPLFRQYQGIFDDQIQRGTIEIAPRIPQGKLVHYLPHHAVINLLKATTKVRMVFDGSAKASPQAPSLNDCMYRGPSKLPELPGILLRLRKSNIMITGDIEKAFHQVYLNEESRDAVRFFWVKDPAEPAEGDNLIIYRFVGVPFGIIASLFFLLACIHIILHRTQDPQMTALEKNIYVDNIFLLADDVEEGIEKFRKVRECFSSASMNVREWLSNSNELNEQIPEEIKQASTTTKVLGLEWNSNTDTFKIHLKDLKLAQTWTKRNVLKFVASTFDPLGLLSPVTVKGRIFLQKLFKEAHSWDEPLNSMLTNEWKSIYGEWNGFVEVPRKLVETKLPPPKDIEIHTFADASRDAYCACVYLRIKTEDGYSTPLVFAKTRLQPLSKTLTIPKMEVMGIWLASKIGSFVAKEMELEECRKFIWTDSQISFFWSQKHPKNVFVTNRLKEVLSSKAECLFVPGKLNPADLGTRGISFNELQTASTWWSGPLFLQQDKDKWPKLPNFAGDVTQTLMALIQRYKDETQVHQNIKISREFEVENATSWKDLKATVAHQLKLPSADNIPLTPHDLKDAENALIIQEQDIFISSKDEKQFKLTENQDGIKVINCRFDHAEMINPHPIFLPKSSPIAKLIIQETHEKLHHSGIPHTLSKIREKYWIPSGRYTVKQCLLKCGNCKFWKSKPFALPEMPNLPASRVNMSKPFQNTGVDYCGPFKIKGKEEKAWVILFTCFTTRLVHLEPVTSMTSGDFLQSFQRFVARRGVPQYVLSDNAKQFKTTATALDQLWTTAIKDDQSIDYFNQHEITWDFITERAPWKGGLYERLVALVKNALKQSIGRRFLHFNQFWTFLTEVESTLNCRPLTYVEANESFIIRPIDFLYPALQTTLPSTPSDDHSNDPTFLPSTAGGGEQLAERYNQTLIYLDKFWKLWCENYLNFLCERNQSQHKNHRSAITRQPILDEAVLVYEPDQPRGVWKIARIKTLISSSDGKIRSAEIEYQNGFITKRAINHLYPVEESYISSETQSTTEEMLDSTSLNA